MILSKTNKRLRFVNELIFFQFIINIEKCKENFDN